jgi:hypothetical protein
MAQKSQVIVKRKINNIDYETFQPVIELTVWVPLDAVANTRARYGIEEASKLLGQEFVQAVETFPTEKQSPEEIRAEMDRQNSLLGL